MGMIASGCATPWFANPTPKKDTTQPGASPVDLKQATVAYINGLCTLPEEQRNTGVHELNEGLLPHHVTVSCGRSGDL
jgi:hypothetical protein